MSNTDSLALALVALYIVFPACVGLAYACIRHAIKK